MSFDDFRGVASGTMPMARRHFPAMLASIALSVGLIASITANAAERVATQRTVKTGGWEHGEQCPPMGECIKYYLINASKVASKIDETFRNQNSFFVYTVPEIDSLLSSKDNEIGTLKRNVADLAKANDAMAARIDELEKMVGDLAAR